MASGGSRWLLRLPKGPPDGQPRGPDPVRRLAPDAAGSPAARSLGSIRASLANGSVKSRGGGCSPPTKPACARSVSMNNGGPPAALPDGGDRALSVEDLISLGGIKLIEEFVTFCKSKSLSSRGERTINTGSIADHTVKSKLFQSFGHLLHDEAINAIADAVHGNNQTSCKVCKLKSEALVTNALQIACESMVKRFGIEGVIDRTKGSGKAQQSPDCNENFTTKAPMFCDEKHLSRFDKEASEMEVPKAPMAKPTPTETPAAKDSTANPAIDDKSKSAPAHVIKKRTRSKEVKSRAPPATKLFEPKAINGDSVHPVNKDCAGEGPLLGHGGYQPKDCNVRKTVDLSPELKPVKKRCLNGTNQSDQAVVCLLYPLLY